MDLYPSMFRRRSCRKYDMQPLSEDLLQEIDTAIRGFTPLYPDLPLTWRFAKQVGGRFSVEAPHYLIISGTGRPGEPENAGFLFEQLALWFDANELGCVWLGASKDLDATDTEADLILIAFGRTTEPVHRAPDGFKRKPIDKVTNAPGDACMQAVHLAPSGMNTQPWYFEKQADGTVFVYRQKLKPPLSLLYKHSDIDMGIGLCHYALACEKEGKPFHFSRSATLPGKSGYASFGTIEG